MKKNITFFTERMDTVGGVEGVVDFLASKLHGEYDTSVLVANGSINNQSIYSIERLCTNIPTTNIFNKIRRYPRIISKLNIFFKNNKIDYFVANSAPLACCSILASILFNHNIKIIAVDHIYFDFVERSFTSKIWGVIRRYTYSKCYKVIALTKADHQKYLNINAPSVQIYNMVRIPLDNISTLKNKKLVAVGRLTHQKGFDLLLPAWKKVLKSFPDWQLEIVGIGEDENMLKSLAANLSIEKSVIFYGRSDHIQERYCDASGFILSSRYEGFGLVIVEALACGVPCISFDCKSGPNELIKDGINGFLAKAEDIDDLANKIIQYLSLTDKEKAKMAKNAIYLSQQFSPANILEQWKKKVFQ